MNGQLFEILRNPVRHPSIGSDLYELSSTNLFLQR